MSIKELIECRDIQGLRVEVKRKPGGNVWFIYEQVLDAKDPELLRKVFTGIEYSISGEMDQACSKVLSFKDEGMLRVFLELENPKFDPDQERQILQTFSGAFLAFYQSKNRLDYQNVLDLINENIAVDPCCRMDILNREIENCPFVPDEQVALVGKDLEDLLILHFKKYGLAPTALSYWYHRLMFKERYGL